MKELQGLLEDERATSTSKADSRAALEKELQALRDEHAGSKDAIAALTAQVDELRASGEALDRKLTEARAEAAAFEATVGELREELASRGDTGELEQELAAVREDVARLEQVSEQRKAKVKKLAQELRNAQDGAAGLEQRVDEREQALAREAEARAAVELQLASLGASADALDQRLQEECAAHVATRRELGRLEADLAELQPLTDKLAATETELASCARLLEEVSAGLDSAKERIGERTYDPDRHVVFVPVEGVYRLADMSGPTPEVGAYEDIDGVRFLVTRIGRSPLPADTRRCAFLEVA